MFSKLQQLLLVSNEKICYLQTKSRLNTPQDDNLAFIAIQRFSESFTLATFVIRSNVYGQITPKL